MQTILGSGGVVADAIAKELTKFTTDIRLVSRNPKKVNSTDNLFAADLTNLEQTRKAVEGSEICYLAIGFPYSAKIWAEKWPITIKNVVIVCIEQNVKLVFFDNVYALDSNAIPNITEESPMNPESKKGKTRELVDKIVLENMEQGKIQAIIARAPNVYGPVEKNSFLMGLVYDYLKKNQTAKWVINADVKHTMGYLKDLAYGTVLLGNTPDTYNQIWNLPVDPNPLTGREWVKLYAEAMGKKNKVQILPAWLLRVLSLFIPVMGELYEMRYQYDRDYIFDSSKFNKRFNYTATPNEIAVKQLVEILSKK